MTQKERLTELLEKHGMRHITAESCAMMLLNNGVIVPSCKVGDVVYVIAPDCEYQYASDCDASCAFCEHRRSTIETWVVKSLYQVIAVLQSWGTNCFSTYAAAEQALKERSNDSQ